MPNNWEDPLHLWIHNIILEGMRRKASSNWHDIWQLGKFIFFITKVEAVIQQFNPSSYFKFVNKDCSKSSSNDNFNVIFCQFFWTFKSYIEALDHVKSIIKADSIFLQGMHRGTLLIATSQDGNQNVISFAFGFVKVETK